MVDYTKLAATAKRLIEANGRTVTLSKLNRDPADAAKPWRGPTTPPDEDEGGLSFDVLAAFVPASGSGMGKMLFDSEESLAKRADQVALVATNSVTAAGFTAADLEECDVVTDGSTVWKIVQIAHLQPSITSLIFALAVKA